MLKKSLKDYRQGATGSIIDEYERALFELKSILQNISEKDYSRIVEGESEHCCSIQIIMNHVVRAGYGYANYIRTALSIDVLPIVDKKIAQTEISKEIDKVLNYTIEIFDGRWQAMNEQMTSVYMETRWDVKYNIDQLMEHAIVHVLRHRRQIEKFLLTFQD